MSISQPFEELQGSNAKFKPITPKPIAGTYFDTIMSRFGLAGFPISAILDFLDIDMDYLAVIFILLCWADQYGQLDTLDI